ncbi:CBS domain-containing protein [Thiothrix eikelboomii]|uniref:CBS domain-containing protein n=1 Tax=Thiothrix eikelboomii TaxID=92487 RepID=A0A1T4VXK7_9GAMM|nr:CBS domain-containing protein [Thiothrix eikelboomii]SKA69750.1 CBS domain-containing protein [Thiothrix eikelboomii]
MRTVREFLNSANQTLATISPEETVYQALTLMAERNLTALLVVKNKALVGIFSERDYARKIILKGKRSRETQVGEIMTAKLITVEPSETVNECMSIMTERRVRHLPIVNPDGEMLGIISIGDVMKIIMEEQRFMIKELKRYIAG